MKAVLAAVAVAAAARVPVDLIPWAIAAVLVALVGMVAVTHQPALPSPGLLVPTVPVWCFAPGRPRPHSEPRPVAPTDDELAVWLAQPDESVSWAGPERVAQALATASHRLHGPRWDHAAPVLPARRRWVAYPATRALEVTG